jgi:excisionase family DNA binding protein
VRKYLTIAEAAPPAGMTEKAFRQRLARGQLPYRKLGRRILIPADELEKFLAALPGTTAEEAIAAVEERAQW